MCCLLSVVVALFLSLLFKRLSLMLSLALRLVRKQFSDLTLAAMCAFDFLLLLLLAWKYIRFRFRFLSLFLDYRKYMYIYT